jgi:cytochrome c556
MPDQAQETQAILEIRKTKETASRLANGEYPKDADHIRVLAGLIQQLAQQTERLVDIGVPADSRETTAAAQVGNKEAEATIEEDQSPTEGPADPINTEPRTDS